MQRAGKSEESKDINITADGGIVKTILKEGSGEPIPAGMLAKVHYVGKLLNGTEFDSSRRRNSPFQFTVGAREVILGWDKGVATMKKGEVCILKCGPDYAYGRSGTGPIPPNATLSFEVELLDWEEPSAASKYLKFVLFALIALAMYLAMNKSTK